MKSVLLLCWRDIDHPQGGGSERYLERVGAELAADGVRVVFRTARYPGSARSEVRDGMEFSRGGGRYTVFPRALGAIIAGRFGFGPLRGLKPDAIIDTQNGIPFFASLVTRVPVTVLVHHCHREQWPVAGPVIAQVGWAIESRIAPRVFRRNRYLTVSDSSAAELVEVGVDPRAITVAHNGVDPISVASANLPAAQQPRLVVLSRLVPHKHIEDAITAVERLRTEYPTLTLDIVGDGWWAGELKSFALSSGVGGRVNFHGHVDDACKHEILAQAWVQLLPSRKEGWGITVIEAAQHAVPTIGYRHSAGLNDSIVDGVTGRIVENLHQMVGVTRELLEDADLRARLGAAARERSEQFSWPATAAVVRSVIDR